MLLTVTQVASRMERTPPTVRRWIRDCGLPAKRHPGSGRMLIKSGDLHAWADGMEPANLEQDEVSA